MRWSSRSNRARRDRAPATCDWPKGGRMTIISETTLLDGVTDATSDALDVGVDTGRELEGLLVRVTATPTPGQTMKVGFVQLQVTQDDNPWGQLRTLGITNLPQTLFFYQRDLGATRQPLDSDDYPLR